MGACHGKVQATGCSESSEDRCRQSFLCTHHQLLKFFIAAATFSPSSSTHPPLWRLRWFPPLRIQPCLFRARSLPHTHFPAPAVAFLFKLRFRQQPWVSSRTGRSQRCPTLLHDKAINISVYDSLSTPRITLRMRLPFAYNDVCISCHLRMLRDKCTALKESKSTVFAALRSTACVAWRDRYSAPRDT